MPARANLISDSLLVLETIDYLVSVGGAAPAARLVDYVMNIADAPDEVACRLMEAVVDRDARLRLNGNVVELDEPDHDAIDLCDTSFVVFDLETTGAKAPPCRITEIGACKVENCELVGEFHTLVNPEVPIPAFITALTGISDEMVTEAPTFRDVADEFLDFIGDSVLVAHNSPFDLGFLNHEISMVHDEARVWNPALCTVQLSRRLLPDIENHKLKTVASYYSVDLVNHHRAGDDARATARIFINFLKMLNEQGINNLGAARKFSQRRHYARRKVAA